MYCQHCKRQNHNTNDCFHLGSPKCDNCGRFGHLTKNCWDAETLKRKRKEKAAKNTANKKAKQEQTNAGIVEVATKSEERRADFLVFEGKGSVVSITDDEDYNGLEAYDPNGIIEEQVLYYDWLADSATTSYITNC
jgi:hypothetical protein